MRGWFRRRAEIRAARRSLDEALRGLLAAQQAVIAVADASITPNCALTLRESHALYDVIVTYRRASSQVESARLRLFSLVNGKTAPPLIEDRPRG